MHDVFITFTDYVMHRLSWFIAQFRLKIQILSQMTSYLAVTECITPKTKGIKVTSINIETCNIAENRHTFILFFFWECRNDRILVAIICYWQKNLNRLSNDFTFFNSFILKKSLMAISLPRYNSVSQRLVPRDRPSSIFTSQALLFKRTWQQF